MREDRLLERIRTWKASPLARAREDPMRVVESVLGHLQRILNTRQGSVPIAEDYGLPDLTDINEDYPDSLTRFERAIRLTIQKYEPRLKVIRVRFVPDEEDLLSLRFQIVGKLAAEDLKDTVYFESVVESDGRVSVRR
ncbi:type VI secretion system baseplate subunit TssE [Desulfatiglans anilini]|uniref:type VI secretion system baseplate subunit TssE n=1 Tax=Desulfatiglans anilini TaxID=90728 RepID=UPI0003F68DF4|nr:type VI secretion system baseplate subunit TssE [Desulfatiglans anilini]